MQPDRLMMPSKPLQLTSACLRSRRCPTATPDTEPPSSRLPLRFPLTAPAYFVSSSSRRPSKRTATQERAPAGSLEMRCSLLGVCVQAPKLSPSVGPLGSRPSVVSWSFKHQSPETPHSTVAYPSTGDIRHGCLLITACRKIGDMTTSMDSIALKFALYLAHFPF